MLITSAWKEVYERFDNILMMDVVEHIRDIDPIVIERPGKQTVYVRLLGDVCPQDGLVVYFTPEDFCIATLEECYIWCESDAGLCLQTGIIGLFGEKEYVSRYNQNILQELGIQADGKSGLLPHFDKLEYGYLPGKVTSADAEELVNILMHVERLLTEIGDIEAVPEGNVLLRRYDDEKKCWFNGITEHPIIDMLEQDHFGLPEPALVTAIQNIPGKGIWDVVLQVKDDECRKENGKSYYPLCLSIDEVHGSTMKLLGETLFSPAELQDGGLFRYLCQRMQQNGKPAQIQCSDLATFRRLRSFCEAVEIQVENNSDRIDGALIDLIQENRETLWRMMQDVDGKDPDSVKKLETFLLDAFEKRAAAEISYVFSVSLGTGLYRHIRIDANATLDELHHAILNAFGFEEDGHLYMFTPTGKKPYLESYMSPYADMEKNVERANEHTIAEVLPVGSRCTYLFDFGDEWTFTCKVLRQIDEPTETPVVIRRKGEDPVQYPAYDNKDE